ncbi:MAG: hypothetical protein JWS12_125 [Candidatus Saccharibacteria bacterium]|nr:hypothetical protein [Candidatus Saccharibacteria bacterium]
MDKHSFAKTVFVTGLTLGIGVGVGITAENHTNEVARGKALTAATCLNTIPHESIVTKSLDECFEQGVPGGNKISKNKFRPGDPIKFVGAYMEAQRQEAEKIEAARVVAWSVVPDVVAAAGIAYLLFLDFI